MIVRPSLGSSRHLALSLPVLVVVVLVFSFMEERSDEVQNTVSYIS